MATGQCFVCGSDNPFGLNIPFDFEGNEAAATFRCEERHVGWPGILHGGITAALLDEASGYVPRFLGVIAMTAKLEVTFLEPIRLGEVVRVSGRCVRQTRRLIEVASEIMGADGSIRARGSAKMVVLTECQQAELGLETPSQP